MRFGRNRIWVSGLVLTLAAIGADANAKGVLAAMRPAQQQQTPNAPTPQSVPDAPTPQTLPQLNTITPVQSAVPEAPAPTPVAAKPAAAPVQEEDPSLIAPAPGQGETELKKLVVNVQFIQLTFTVKDSKGHLVPGLRAGDVRVYEDGVKQNMRFWTADPLPLSVALVIDQSVTYDTMEKINTSLSALQGAFSKYDEIAVFTYNNGVVKQTDFTGAQSPRLGVVLDRSKGQGREPLMGTTGALSHGLVVNNAPIDGVPDPGHSAGSMQINIPKEYHTLNDAILEAAKETASVDRSRRRVVYVISDGKEYGSKATQKEVIQYLQRNNVTVYATLVGDASIPGMGFLDRIHIPLTMRDDVLPKYTTATGGGFDPEFRPKGIEESFQKLADEVRAQYTLGYYTQASKFDEKFRRTEIRVLRPGLTIIAPDGYYPSAFTRPSRPVAATSTPAAPASNP